MNSPSKPRYTDRLVRAGVRAALEQLGRLRHLLAVYEVLHDAIWRTGKKRRDRQFHALWRDGAGYVVSTASVPELIAGTGLSQRPVYYALSALTALGWIRHHGGDYYSLGAKVGRPLYIEAWLSVIEKGMAEIGMSTAPAARKQRADLAVKLLENALSTLLPGAKCPAPRSKTPCSPEQSRVGRKRVQRSVNTAESAAEILLNIQSTVSEELLPSSETEQAEEQQFSALARGEGAEDRCEGAGAPSRRDPESLPGGEPLLKESSAPTPLPRESESDDLEDPMDPERKAKLDAALMTAKIRADLKSQANAEKALRRDRAREQRADANVLSKREVARASSAIQEAFEAAWERAKLPAVALPPFQNKNAGQVRAALSSFPLDRLTASVRWFVEGWTSRRKSDGLPQLPNYDLFFGRLATNVQESTLARTSASGLPQATLSPELQAMIDKQMAKAAKFNPK